MGTENSFDYWAYFLAETERAAAPLYTTIVRGIAADTELKTLAARAKPGQPQANILLGAAHYLLLNGAQHPLRRFYPNLNGGRRTKEESPFPSFRDFVHQHHDDLLPLIKTRVTNTNEIGRCSALHAGFRAVAAESGDPLHLIELGPSAGLNLRWDSYRVRYDSTAQSICSGPHDPPVTLECELRGEKTPPAGPLPRIASRIGLERNPVDLSDAGQRNWLKALVWPDHLARFERLEKAIVFFREQPAEIRAGDALALLPEAIARVPENEPVCIYHTFVVYQFTEEMREALHYILIVASLRRPIWRLSCEGSLVSIGEAPLRLWRYRDGRKESRLLGVCQSHGAWLEWRD